MPTIDAVPVVGDEFVGRGWEVARLDGVLDDVARGRGRVVVVTGEAGIGKTALLDAAASRAGDRGFAVAVGRCAASEAPPYWPWPQALRALDGAGDAATVEANTIPGGRPALFAAAAERLERSSRRRPAFVVVDDLHWADESSLALATFLVAAVTGLPVAVAFGVRDEPADMRPGVQAMLDGLPADVERIPLGGLDERDTAELLRAVLAHDPAPSMVAEVYGRTAGNPFFVKEVGRLVAAQGERAAATVPEGVRKVLTRRVARLSRPAFDVLAAAAVADDFDHELLAAMTDLPPADVAAHLDEALDARLAVLDEGRHGFAHALVRQTILDLQPSAPRSEAYRSAAVVLEARIEDAAPALRAAVAGRAAAHWAQVPDGRSRAATLAVVAARAAAGQLGFEQAARLYRWARELGDDEVETLTALGEAEVLAGRFAEGRRTLALAAEQARSARRGEAVARAVLAAGAGIGGFEVDVRDERQVMLLNEALALLGDGDSGLRAAALARLALIDARLPEDERVELTDAAAAMAVRLGDAALEVSALAARCDILSGPDHVDERLATSGRMVALAEGHGDPFMVLLARRHRLLALLERGRIGQVDDQIAAYARTSERLRVPLFSWTVPLWRGMRALLDGDIDGAMDCCAAADQLGRAAESHNADTLVLTQRFEIARASGSTASLDGDVRRMVRAYEGYPPVDGMRAVHALMTGRQDEARRVLRRRMSAGIESVPRDSEWLETLWNLGDVAVAVGEREAAAQIYDALSPYADLWVIDGVGAACYGVVSHLLGRLAISLGRESEARRWLRDADGAYGAAGVDVLARATAALVETLDPHVQPAAVAASVVDHGRFVRSGSVWQVHWRDVSAAVRHSKGLLDIARLLERPGREIHALDLVDATGSTSPSGGAGPMLDDAARRSYARRLRDLEEDLADAMAAADDGRVTRLDHEREFLLAELSRAYGIGGRARTAADPAERARKAVGMRIATALRSIAAVHPQLARHLDRSLVTGRFCSYQPESPTTWTVERDTAGAAG